MLLFFPLVLLAHGDHRTHNHENSPGGPLLNGYPWGLFSLNISFAKRVLHKKNDQELKLANKIFESLARADAVAFPFFLEHKNFKPFGDGQSNAQASFNTWKKTAPPLIAIWIEKTKTLKIFFHESIIKDKGEVIVRFPDGAIKKIGYNKNDGAGIDIDDTKLGWNKLGQGKVIFAKPAHWNDWFGIQFQKPNVLISELVSHIPVNLIYKSIPNPLKIKASISEPPLLQLMNQATKNEYEIFATDKVHSIYPNPKATDFVHKSSGGNWTFLLKPALWEKEGHEKETFKQLYSCFEGRSYWEESTRKSVSGTSWHHVGDPGEIILNSITDENRSLVTAIANKIEVPEGITLAYNLNFIGYASLTRPGYAFVSSKGQYHWHPIHTPNPICVEVWTPEAQPSVSNGFGFKNL